MDRESLLKSEFAYKINQIQTIKFIYNSEIDVFKAQSLVESSNLEVQINYNHFVVENESSFRIDIKVKFIDVSDGLELFEYIGRTKFFINGLESLKTIEGYKIPDSVLIQLFSLSYSHARALLSVELNATVFKDLYFLPVINPVVFLNNQKDK